MRFDVVNNAIVEVHVAATQLAATAKLTLASGTAIKDQPFLVCESPFRIQLRIRLQRDALK